MNPKKTFLFVFVSLFFLGGWYVKQTPKTETGQTEEQTTNVFLVALEDDGKNGRKIGCGDSVLAVTRTISSNTDLIETTLSDLLSLKEQYYGESGLYNSLYQSDLKIEKINLNNGTAEVYLTGEYLLSGTCDNPRFDAQIRQTVLQFPEIEKANIFINGTEIKRLLSGSGV